MKKAKLPIERPDFFDLKLKDKCHAIYKLVKEAIPDRRNIKTKLEEQIEFYKRVYIKSDADLPKEGQLVFYQNNDGFIKESKFREKYKDEWLSEVDWYLKPVKLDMSIEKLIKTQDELIKLYGDIISRNSVFLSVHGMNNSKSEILKGQELRTKIALLKSEIERRNLK